MDPAFLLRANLSEQPSNPQPDEREKDGKKELFYFFTMLWHKCES